MFLKKSRVSHNPGQFYKKLLTAINKNGCQKVCMLPFWKTFNKTAVSVMSLKYYTLPINIKKLSKIQQKKPDH